MTDPAHENRPENISENMPDTSVQLPEELRGIAVGEFKVAIIAVDQFEAAFASTLTTLVGVFAGKNGGLNRRWKYILGLTLIDQGERLVAAAAGSNAAAIALYKAADRRASPEGK